MLRSLLTVTALLALNGIACAGGRIPAPVGPAAAPDAVQSPIVSVGTTFHARLESPIFTDPAGAGRGYVDPARARVGDVLTAQLDEPLIAGDGSRVAPRGATLTGRVLDVERDRVTVRFDRLHFDGRAYPIATTLLRAELARPPMPLGTGGGPNSTDPPEAGRGYVNSVESQRGAMLLFVVSRPFSLPLSSGAESANEVESAGEADRTFE